MEEVFLNRDIVIIEGELTRFGVNNDLLSKAKSIKIILVPAKNAFNYYDNIFQKSKKLIWTL